MFDEDQTPTPFDLPNFPRVAGLQVIDVVASGGYGTVYRARQLAHDRMVALKVLDARFVDEATRRRFDRERVALGRISDHPAIVSLLDSGYTEDGSPFLLLELAPGGSLADRLDGAVMRLDEATAMVIILAGAVEKMHDAGVVHRDIKPDNIMRSAYGDWRLTDFGIASLTDQSATGVVHATYAHTAPETFHGEPPSPACDVYSLASVLATCLTGIEPFAMAPGEAPVSVMRRVASDPYPDLRSADVPDDLAVLLEAALSKDASHRPVTAQAFGAALNAVRSAHGLMPIAIRTGNESATNATTIVDEADLAMAQPNLPNAGLASPVAPRAPRRGVRLLAAAALVAILFGFGFVATTMVAEGAGGDLFAALQDIGEPDEPRRPEVVETTEEAGEEVGPEAVDEDDDGNNDDDDDNDDNDGDNDNNGPGNGANANNGNGNGPGNGNGNGNGNGGDGGPGNGDGGGPGNGNGGRGGNGRGGN